MSLPPLPRRSRSPWQRLLEVVHERRRRRSAKTARRLPRPVLSIGNLHLGGSGKTPLCLAVATHLRDRGRRVAILSRGYKRRSRGLLVVSDGEGPRVSVEAAGDEPFLLARALPGVAVVVGAERHAAGILALEQLSPTPELFLLDDGFSHVRLKRDLDLLAFPRLDPFGGGRLLPSGRLREPLGAVRYADAVLLTGLAGGDGGEGGGELARRLAPLGFEGPGFSASLRTRLEKHQSLITTSDPVLLISAVARPRAVYESAVGTGLDVRRHLSFPDHHSFPASSLRRIESAARQGGVRGVVCTSKDWGKLSGRLQTPIAELVAESAPESAFWDWLEERLTRLVAVS